MEKNKDKELMKKIMDIYDLAITTIQNNKNIFFTKTLIAYLPISTSTFYKYFTYSKVSAEAMESIQDLLNKNKVKAKDHLINSMMSGRTSPSEKIFMFRLLANEDEKLQLNPVHEVRQVEPPKHHITLVEEAK